jgi:hypothetical protein
MKDLREDEELRDGREKRGRCEMSEREEGEMWDKGEVGDGRWEMGEISDEVEKRRRRESVERGGGDRRGNDQRRKGKEVEIGEKERKKKMKKSRKSEESRDR